MFAAAATASLHWRPGSGSSSGGGSLRSGGGAPSPSRHGPLPSHRGTSRSGGRGGVGAAAAASSGAPGKGPQERSPRAFVGAGAAATAAAAGNHTGSSVPGCSSCCHDDDVTDATTGGRGEGGVCGEGRLRVVRGRGLGGKRSERAGARAGHGGRGPRRCFLPHPGHAAREAADGWQGPRGIDDSAGGHGHLGEGQRKGRRSTDLMDGLRGACGRGGASVRGRFGGYAGLAGAAVLTLASPTAISHPAEEAGAAAETVFHKVHFNGYQVATYLKWCESYSFGTVVDFQIGKSKGPKRQLTGSHDVAQAGLELLGSSQLNLPTSWDYVVQMCPLPE
ncbi:spidroin-1-like isoform X5 [Gorilla gorilla gorilla]|uniref:spidroin-1-like isoform X5 n=1 Tax=Gorilla gorilla gorilla TaxID=9595 RepID=UPI00300AB755